MYKLKENTITGGWIVVDIDGCYICRILNDDYESDSIAKQSAENILYALNN
jgi:hypothetical protein